MSFISAMNNYSLNEKNALCYTLEGSVDKESIGLVNLYNDAVGRRGKTALTEKDYLIKYTQLADYILNKINTFNAEKKLIYLKYYIKLLFLIRDHKDGNGERDIFYTLFINLYDKYPLIVKHTLHLLTGGHNVFNNYESIDKPYGSFLDLNKLYMLAKPEIFNNFKQIIIKYYIECLKIDNNEEYPSLCVKWVPRENKKYHKIAEEIVNSLYEKNNLNNKFKSYRKLLKVISDKIVIIEKLMSTNNWDMIEIKNIPGKALKKYLYAFKNEYKNSGKLRHPNDVKRMELRDKLLNEMNKSPEEAKLNVTTLQPYEIVETVINKQSLLSASEEQSIIALWNKYSYEFKKNIESDTILKENLNMLILADVSGSMSGRPMEACIALSLLLTDMLNSTWKNKILTFESNPRWHNIPDNYNIIEKIKHLKSASWGGTTNIGKALELILTVATKNNIAKNDMPKKMIIFSDMQFDRAMDYNDSFKTGYELLESKFKNAGYELPHIIFWNLRGDTYGYNNKTNQKGTTMLSGFSPVSFKAFLNGNFDINNSPWDTLKELLESNRYNNLDTIIDSYM